MHIYQDLEHYYMNEKSTLQNSRHEFKSSGKNSRNLARNPNPTLGTIKMVEETLAEMQEYPTKNKLWRSLPRQVQYPIFNEILKYLKDSKKLIFDKDGTIVWIFVDNPELKKLREDTKELLNQ